ncbi:MAG: DUF2183 domain-containing protein [Alphaproteobacteria bacterium]|nr:MAG: DUF2183 domain-containing protein [Alphaproteobacteria bacterium]
MKKWICVLVIIFSINTLQAKTLIVSDVDDTVKVTDVLNKANAVYNALFSKAAFSGMSALYRELNTSESLFYYVSGSPTFLENKITTFLEFNNFPQKENLILKNGMNTPTYDYKLAAISKIIKAENPDKVILIGDDTEYDPEVYETISKNFPGKVESIYIRAIRNRELPKLEVMKNFFSTAEIAGFEILKGDLGSMSLVKVATSFIRKDNESKIFIKERYCPAEGRGQIEELKQSVRRQIEIATLELVQQKIISTCTNVLSI